MKRSATPDNNDPGDEELVELDGYVDLGMATEAVSLAGAILKRRNLAVVQFENAVMALLLHGDRPSAWRRRIEKAFEMMAARQKQKVGRTMLAYYWTVGDFRRAAQFVSWKSLRGAEYLYFAMEALLETGKIAEADRLARRCLKALNDPENQPRIEMLLQALADYFCHKGDLARARAAWKAMPLGGAFTQDALAGVVETHLAEALLAADGGLAALNELTKMPTGCTELIVPGNDAGLIEDARKALVSLRKAVGRALPAERQKELGVGRNPSEPTA